MYARLKEKNIETTNREFYIGGVPPSKGFQKGSTDSMREWAKSAAEKPVPIKYKLSPIVTLITKKFFRYLDTGTNNFKNSKQFKYMYLLYYNTLSNEVRMYVNPSAIPFAVCISCPNHYVYNVVGLENI